MPRAAESLATVLLVLGLAGLAVGAVILVSNMGSSSGVGGALQGLATFVGGAFVLAGLAALVVASLIFARGRPPGAKLEDGSRWSRSMAPGVILLLAGILLGVAGVLGAQSWVLVPGILSGLVGLVLFARSGSPDEPA